MIKREFTAVYKKQGNQYIAWIEEIPGVNTQGRTQKEVRENLAEALRLILSANRSIARKNLGKGLKKENITIAIPA